MSTQSKVQTYLSFKMNDESFAINVSKVTNILEMKPITKMPNTLSYMKGVINLRGDVLPIIDLRLKFGLKPKETTVDTSIIVMNIEKEGKSIMIGALVDAVKEVLELEDDVISKSPSFGTKYTSDFIQGMYRIEDKFIMIIDIDAIFSVDDVINVQQQTKKEEKPSKKENGKK